MSKDVHEKFKDELQQLFQKYGFTDSIVCYSKEAENKVTMITTIMHVENVTVTASMVACIFARSMETVDGCDKVAYAELVTSLIDKALGLNLKGGQTDAAAEPSTIN